MNRATLLLLALSANPAVAQTEPPVTVTNTVAAATPAAPKLTGDDAVVVQGLTRKRLNDIVGDIIQAKPRKPIAKYRDWLCISVEGLRPEFKRILENRIRQVAQDAGVRQRTKRCLPNLLVVAPPDPDGFAEKLTRDHPMLFGDPNLGMAPQSLIVALHRPRPVRWFAVTQIKDTGGGMWRLQAPARADKLLLVVILDMDKLNGLTWRQLGDYVGLVSFANPKMDTIYPSGPTILSLFTDRDAGRPLLPERTQLDRSLLAATYGVDENLSAPLQRTRIVDNIAKRRVGRRTDPDGDGKR